LTNGVENKEKHHGFYSAVCIRNQIETEIVASLECASSACAFEGGSRAAALQI
jgi:hypothetical protein